MKHSIKKLSKTIGYPLLTLPLLIAANTASADETSEKHSYKFGGFIKATATFSDYSDGDIAEGSLGRDFYVPFTIPTSGTGGDRDFDFGAKESRINFKSSHQLKNGDKITSFIEMDFLGSSQGNELVSNSYSPRLRHAFFTYNNLLVGQTWSTFQDVKALPEAVDFLGASEGIIFNRQTVLRYTSGAFQFAMENSQSYIDGDSDDNSMPDLVARYNHKADWGHVSVAAIYRQLNLETDTTDESATGSGISVTGKFKVGAKDDIRVNFATGSGINRYAGIVAGATKDAVLENGNLETTDLTNFAVAYRHQWNSQWRSNVIYSALEVDNVASLADAAVTESINSVQVNLLYSPVPKMTFGVGILDATRELENGDDGDMNRFIFTAKYAF